MKKQILLGAILLLSIFSIKASERQNDHQEKHKSNDLVILLTSKDADVADRMALMYANFASQPNQYDNVTVIIWGASAKMVSRNRKIQAKIEQLIKKGVKIEACIACSDLYKVTDKLRMLGYDVKPMGAPLTEYIKSGKYILAI